MKHLSTTPTRWVLSTSLGIGLLIAGFAVQAMPEPLAALVISGGEVVWEPKISNYRQLVLTVSTPNGDVFEQSFPVGTQPFFTTIQNGSHTYEMHLEPQNIAPGTSLSAASSETIDAFGRSPSGTRGFVPTSNPDNVQSGSFSVVGGNPVNPTLQEE